MLRRLWSHNLALGHLSLRTHVHNLGSSPAVPLARPSHLYPHATVQCLLSSHHRECPINQLTFLRNALSLRSTTIIPLLHPVVYSRSRPSRRSKDCSVKKSMAPSIPLQSDAVSVSSEHIATVPLYTPLFFLALFLRRALHTLCWRIFVPILYSIGSCLFSNVLTMLITTLLVSGGATGRRYGTRGGSDGGVVMHMAMAVGPWSLSVFGGRM